MPQPDRSLVSDGLNRMIQDELRYDKEELFRDHQTPTSKFIDEQQRVYDEIMTSVNSNKGGVFFFYGHGGTGKTFIWGSLSAAIRSRGEIVLSVASSGIASLLIAGGRMAHSRFRIPIEINEDSTCDIKLNTYLADMISKAKLIIWDEAPMVNKYRFEALDRSLRDVMRLTDPNNLKKSFGGKIVVFGGDFRQVLAVVLGGSKQDIVYSAINSSYLWRSCKVLRLTRNMRLEHGGDAAKVAEANEFFEWILKIGDGNLGRANDGETIIEISPDLLIKEASDPISTIVEDEETVYLSSNSLCKIDQGGYVD